MKLNKSFCRGSRGPHGMGDLLKVALLNSGSVTIRSLKTTILLFPDKPVPYWFRLIRVVLQVSYFI
jgi:hypothetical protein